MHEPGSRRIVAEDESFSILLVSFTQEGNGRVLRSNYIKQVHFNFSSKLYIHLVVPKHGIVEDRSEELKLLNIDIKLLLKVFRQPG